MADTDLHERAALEAKPKSKLFKGLTFATWGPQPGYTVGKLTRLIKKHGGKVSDEIRGNADVSHVILSGQIWGKQGTPAADPLVKLILEANEANASESDSELNRVWMLDVDWVFASIERGKLVKEYKHDFDLKARGDTEARKAKRKAKLEKERKANKGESVFGRGERVRWENDQKVKRAEAEAEKLAAQMDVDPTTDRVDFSGVGSLQGKAQPVEGGGAAAGISPNTVEEHGSEERWTDEEEEDFKSKGKGKAKSLKHFGFEKDNMPVKAKESPLDSDSSIDIVSSKPAKKPSASTSSKLESIRSKARAKSKRRSEFSDASSGKQAKKLKKQKSTKSRSDTEREDDDVDIESLITSKLKGNKAGRKRAGQKGGKKPSRDRNSSDHDGDATEEEEDESASDLNPLRKVRNEYGASKGRINSMTSSSKASSSSSSSKPTKPKARSNIKVTTRTVTRTVPVDKGKDGFDAQAKAPRSGPSSTLKPASKSSSSSKSAKMQLDGESDKKKKYKKQDSSDRDEENEDKVSSGAEMAKSPSTSPPRKKKNRIVISDSEEGEE